MFLFIFNPICINFEFPAQNLNFWREKCVYLALVAAAAAFAVMLVDAESLCFLMASYGLLVVDIDSSDWDLRIFSDEPTPILTGPVGCAPVPFGPPCKSLIDVISQVLIYVWKWNHGTITFLHSWCFVCLSLNPFVFKIVFAQSSLYQNMVLFTKPINQQARLWLWKLGVDTSIRWTESAPLVEVGLR